MLKVNPTQWRENYVELFNFHVNIADGNEPIEIVNQNNKERNMMELYISIQIPLAIALLFLLPLLGVGVCWLYRRFRNNGDSNDA